MHTRKCKIDDTIAVREIKQFFTVDGWIAVQQIINIKKNNVQPGFVRLVQKMLPQNPFAAIAVWNDFILYVQE